MHGTGVNAELAQFKFEARSWIISGLHREVVATLVNLHIRERFYGADALDSWILSIREREACALSTDTNDD